MLYEVITEDMHLHAQAVEGALVVGVVGGQALDEHIAVRRQDQLVGDACQVVLGLVEAAGTRSYNFV